MFFSLNPFVRRAKRQQLTASEKQDVRRDLEVFMRAHPVREIQAARQLSQRSTSWWASFIKTSSFLLKPLPIALLIVLALGTGTVSAAEETLPDHPLYFIKVHVNEPVRRSFARTPEEKATIEADLALRRLDEARALAERESLSAAEQVEVQERFVAQASRVEAQVKKLAASGRATKAEEVARAFEERVERRTKLVQSFQGQVLSATTTTTTLDTPRLTTSTQQILPVLKKAREKIDELKEERKERRREQKEQREERREDRERSREGASSSTADRTQVPVIRQAVTSTPVVTPPNEDERPRRRERLRRNE